MAYYAVSSGRRAGVYDTWAQCEEQVKGFKNAKYKKFKTRQEAELFVNPTTSFEPHELAVPLGGKQPQPASWRTKVEKIEKPNYTEAWPEEDHDLAEDELVNIPNTTLIQGAFKSKQDFLYLAPLGGANPHFYRLSSEDFFMAFHRIDWK